MINMKKNNKIYFSNSINVGYGYYNNWMWKEK